MVFWVSAFILAHKGQDISEWAPEGRMPFPKSRFPLGRICRFDPVPKTNLWLAKVYSASVCSVNLQIKKPERKWYFWFAEGEVYRSQMASGLDSQGCYVPPHSGGLSLICPEPWGLSSGLRSPQLQETHVESQSAPLSSVCFPLCR